MKNIFLQLVFWFGLFFMLVGVGEVIKAEDNKTSDEPRFTAGGFPLILDGDRWPSQLLYDTIGACYQGTIRWIIITNPSLLGQMPGPGAQRQMVEHCFCVMDKVRKEQPLEEYKKKVFDQQFIGDLFMVKAIECIGEYKTLPSFFTKAPIPDNETKQENKTTIIPEEPKDSNEESLPGQPKEESNGLPETIFQG